MVQSKNNHQPQELSSQEIHELKESLIKIREELYTKSKERRADGLYEISRDDLSDEGDLAAVETDQDVGMRLAEHERNKLMLVDRALKKIEMNDGTYGLCEGTGEPIGFKRLAVQPWVLYCMRHQEDLERGRRAL